MSGPISEPPSSVARGSRRRLATSSASSARRSEGSHRRNTPPCSSDPFVLCVSLSSPQTPRQIRYYARLARCRRLVLLHFFQELLDALDVLLREIQSKVQLRQTAKLQAFDDLAADIAGSMFQRLDGVVLLLAGAAHIDEHAGVLHVRLDAHFADHDHPFEAGIL